MQYVNVVTDDSILVLNIENGEQAKFYSDDNRYQLALELLQEEDYESIFEMDIKSVVTNFFQTDKYGDISVKIEDGTGVVHFGRDNTTVPLHPAIAQRILKMNEQGLDSLALVNFISNLYDNPSKTAVDELYLFIEACELPITDDGCFIAYKIVREDYKDIFSGTMDNSIGQTLKMPRNMVDDNRNRTCSAGLHFCSKDYLSYYGKVNNSRCILVKINPADVVSIPSDYNNAKGRTWQYTVVGEVEDPDWRAKLSVADYTNDAVVDSTGCSKSEKGYYESDYEDDYEADDVYCDEE